jgi:imidazole glycerol-phosphate synthase subunit HisF
MVQARIVPVLLLRNRGLVKTVKFDKAKYIGDPINAVRIFNEKEVDEIILLDINASREGKSPDFALIQEIGSEAFIPFAYGGGITTVAQAKQILFAGAEKVIINTSHLRNMQLVTEISTSAGASSTVAAIDVKKNLFGKYRVYSHTTQKNTDHDPVAYCQQLVEMGAGELFINSVDLDGTMRGYDLDLIKKISQSVDVPIIACGGAGNMHDLKSAIIEGGASAAAAGSIFVYHGKHNAVLINYPEKEDLRNLRSFL